MNVFDLLNDIVTTSSEGPTPYIVLGVVVFFVFVEQWMLFSLLSPGSWGVIVVSFVAFSSTISVPLMLVLLFGGAFIGSHAQYLVGKHYSVAFLRLVNRFPKLVDLERIRETRVTTWLVLISYSLPQIRGIIPFLAGASHMPLWRWYAVSTLGIMIWLGIFIVFGMVAANNFNGDVREAAEWAWDVNTNSVMGVFLWITTIAIVVYYLNKWRTRKQN
jgi:membrane-associated protein